MRLGDLDALKKTIEQKFDDADYYPTPRILEEIDNADTVVVDKAVTIRIIPKDYVYDTETKDFYVYRHKYYGDEIHIVKEPPLYKLERPTNELVDEIIEELESRKDYGVEYGQAMEDTIVILKAKFGIK